MFRKLKPVLNEQKAADNTVLTVVYTCPLCGAIVKEKARKCSKCKQRLKWTK